MGAIRQRTLNEPANGNEGNDTLMKIGFIAVAMAATMMVAAPAAAADSKAIAAEIDRVAQAAVAKGVSPGLQIAVFKDGAPVLVKGYGQADLEQQIPVSEASVFRIGSVTKQFTAVAILKLQEESRLSVDDRLTKYLPAFPGADGITIRQLLQHTSGLYNYPDPADATVKLLHRSTAEMVAYLGARPKGSDFAPGSSWSYSNAGYFLLGAIIEKVEGEKLATVLQRRFFAPLGMTRTALDDESEIVRGRAHGYDAEGPGKFKNAELISMTVPGGAGAMRSTASDLARWNAALFGGKVLKPETFAAMTAPGTLANGQGTGAIILKEYGAPSEYGFGIETYIVEGHRKVSHGGAIDGFSASLSEFPQDRMTVVVLSNAIGKGVGADDIAARIERISLGLPWSL